MSRRRYAVHRSATCVNRSHAYREILQGDTAEGIVSMSRVNVSGSRTARQRAHARRSLRAGYARWSAPSGQENHWNVARALLVRESPQFLHTIDTRHHHIEQNQVGRQRCGLLDCIGARDERSASVIEVSGVRISWLTIYMNSPFTRSTSRWSVTSPKCRPPRLDRNIIGSNFAIIDAGSSDHFSR